MAGRSATKERSGLIYETPALRVNNQPDASDEDRARWAFQRFDAQDGSYRLRDRSVEENIRMLAGQQWWQYHHLLGWKDITYWMSDEERRWRQRPVFNRILPWFILTHARMTENSFICTFLPGPDRSDGELAELYDILYKTKWRELGMTDVWDRCAGWMISAGAAFLQSRVDMNKGPWEEWVGKAEVPMVGPDDQPLLDDMGQPRMQLVKDGVPFDKEGKPLAVVRADGLQVLGKPHAERRGDLVMDVFSPLECRGQWGPLPWHEQRVHMSRSYLTPEQVWEAWGVDCEPDVRGEAASNAGFLERILFGSGFFGAASAHVGSEFGGAAESKDGYVCVQTTWQAPNKRIEGMQESPDQPGGRLLVTTKDRTLRDGQRPAAFAYTSPIRLFEFLRLPGRPGGSTPQETMNSPQRAYNTGWKQILENRALCANPQQVVDSQSGLKLAQVNNQPGRQYKAKMRSGVVPITWIVPPAMGADVWRSQEALGREMSYYGSTQGTERAPMTDAASGELIRELRFDDDRFVGPTMRRAAEEMGRVIEDWTVIIPTIHDRKTILNYTGEDNVARTIMLMPELLKTGKVNVVPDVESMLPEGRGERRARVYKMWQDGAFGDPMSPPALRKLHELAKFPHMSRTSKPGGIHWTTAEQENGELLQGGTPPIYDWYDDGIHLVVIEEFMAAPEFRRLPDNIQYGFMYHREMHKLRLVQKQAQMMRDQLEAQDVMDGPGGRRGGKGDGGDPRSPRPGPPSVSRKGVPGGQPPSAAGVSQ